MCPSTTAAIVKRLRDLAYKRQADEQAKLTIQMLIGMHKLQQKGMPGTSELTTELLTMLGQPSLSLFREDLSWGTLTELAYRIDPSLRRDIVINEAQTEQTIARLMREYNINQENYAGKYSSLVNSFFKESTTNGIKTVDLFQGIGLHSYRNVSKHLGSIFAQDSTDPNQVFYCLAGKTHSSYIGIDDATYINFGVNYLATKYKGLYGEEYIGSEALKHVSLHETFANKILAQEFPPEHRNAKDQTLIQELLNIDKLLT